MRICFVEEREDGLDGRFPPDERRGGGKCYLEMSRRTALARCRAHLAGNGGGGQIARPKKIAAEGSVRREKIDEAPRRAFDPTACERTQPCKVRLVLSLSGPKLGSSFSFFGFNSRVA